MSRQTTLLAAAAGGLLAGMTAAVAQAGEPVRLTPGEMDRVTAGLAAATEVATTAGGGALNSTTAQQNSQAQQNGAVETASTSGSGAAVSLGGENPTTDGNATSDATGDRVIRRQGKRTYNRDGVSVTVVYSLAVGLRGPGVGSE